MRVCLNIIYNHKYENNVEKLERYYSAQFRNINHLMPFSRGGEDGKSGRVIPVFESSHNFEGFIQQSFDKFYHDEYDYYIFCADDLLLNTGVNENNFRDWFELDDQMSYIKQLELLSQKKRMFYIPKTGLYLYHGRIVPWYKLEESNHDIYLKDSKKCLISNRFLEIERYLPSLEEWHERFIRIGFSEKELEECGLKRPLILAFSDLVVVPQTCIKEFSYWCGVFAAANLHVELAIPTALLLSCEKIQVESNLVVRGQQNHFNDIGAINFDEIYERMSLCEDLYVHPIKLSQVTLK